MWYLTIHENKVYLKHRIINRLVKNLPQFYNDADVVITKYPVKDEELYEDVETKEKLVD